MTVSKRTIRVGALPQDQDSVVGVAYVGSTGLGKTSLIKKQMLDTHDLIQPALILDTGDDLAEFLRAKGDPRNPVSEVDLYHEGGAGIDLPSMLKTQTDRWRLARRLSPREKNNPNTYFDDAVALVLLAALCVLAHFAKRGYHLADAIRLAKRPQLLTLLARLVPGLDDPFADVRGDPKTFANVMSSLRTRLADVEIVAALMLKCTEFVDLTEPVGSTVIRWSDRHAVALEGLLGFSIDTSIVTRLSEKPLERVSYYLDEFRSIAPLEALAAAFRRGRKHRIAVTVSVHEICGLHDRYNKDVTEEMLGLMAHKVFVRVGSPATAKWSSDYLGCCEGIEDLRPHPGNKNRDVSRQMKDRHNVHWDELRRIKPPDPETDELHFYVDFPATTCEVVAPWLADASLPAGHKPARRVERSPDSEVMPPLTARDLDRLGMPLEKPFLDALK
ncbi:type IV secretion system DNA-binding domain-containing protein [Frigoriglobus tundricola]|uniref:Type IV secretion system coupling protein TraD DNA-binding domain-containing protein n=1 Tax=Frigoriglobus tundricola TaxID=2774151 RepID=A0A6M5Z444_9BACT|nr:type IV secretion system DNA-binding domain-containing protein [Frigoriglobus tundricola]QJX01168.1 hypothetical protein FTUN_8807 [Frigoriglobus tundricola]